MPKEYSVEVKDGVRIIKLPAEIGQDDIEQLNSKFLEWLGLPEKNFAFDVEAAEALSFHALRAFVNFRNLVKKKGGQIVSFNVSKRIQNQIQTLGLDDVFSVKKNKIEALVFFAPPPPKSKSPINPEFVQPFLGAVKNTFEMQVGTTLQMGKPALKTENTPLEGIDIAGVIQIHCSQFTGMVAVCFPAATFLGVCSRMFGESYSEITPEIEDAAAELTNMIFGQVKAFLNDRKGYDIGLALPTVVRGKRLQLYQPLRNIAFVLPFKCDEGSFHLEIATSPTEVTSSKPKPPTG